ncbi:hypothetical protein J7L48_00965, partial [bacterium]|nr:hypothetical protein [bacterium]
IIYFHFFFKKYYYFNILKTRVHNFDFYVKKSYNKMLEGDGMSGKKYNIYPLLIYRNMVYGCDK